VLLADPRPLLHSPSSPKLQQQQQQQHRLLLLLLVLQANRWC
jgi:hypothetical protein